MDSLLASYASSSDDDDEQQNQPQPPNPIPSKTTSSSSTSSLFSSLPQPKQSETVSFFSSLPKPKSQIPNKQQQHQPKKVVIFRPPIIPLPKPSLDDDDDDDDAEEERNRLRKINSDSSIQAPSVKSFLSSIPAPRNSSTLGVQSSSGSGRRSIIETELSEPEPAPAPSVSVAAAEGDVAVDQNVGDYVNYYENYSNYQYATDQNAGEYANYENYTGYGNYDAGGGGGADQGVEAGSASYASYSGYGDNVQYGNNWGEGLAEASGVSDNGFKFPGKKRGRNEIPAEVIEVKQEELIKNRPREDQVKLTGIAFGPTYQPVSAKGKPSKLHKRKHQIGSLYFDAKQNEKLLAERRAKGMLTKAETQAKYGW